MKKDFLDKRKIWHNELQTDNQVLWFHKYFYVFKLNRKVAACITHTIKVLVEYLKLWKSSTNLEH